MASREVAAAGNLLRAMLAGLHPAMASLDTKPFTARVGAALAAVGAHQDCGDDLGTQLYRQLESAPPIDDAIAFTLSPRLSFPSYPLHPVYRLPRQAIVLRVERRPHAAKYHLSERLASTMQTRSHFLRPMELAQILENR